MRQTLSAAWRVASVAAALALPACGGGGGRGAADLSVSSMCGDGSPLVLRVGGGQSGTCLVSVVNHDSVASAPASLVLELDAALSVVGYTCDAGATICSSGSGSRAGVPALPPGGSAAFVFVIATPAGRNGTLSGTARVEQAGESATADNHAAVRVTVYSSDLALTAVAPASVAAGGDWVIQATLANQGPATMVGGLVQAALPEGLSVANSQCTEPDGSACPPYFTKQLSGWSIAVGERQTWRLTVPVPAGYAGALSATVTADTAGDMDLTNNSVRLQASVSR